MRLQNEWRKFVSPTCPGPRSAHAVVASPAGGGKLFLFGEHHLLIFLVRSANVSSQVENSRLYTKTRSTITVTSGVSISRHTLGIALRRRSGLQLALATGLYAARSQL